MFLTAFTGTHRLDPRLRKTRAFESKPSQHSQMEFLRALDWKNDENCVKLSALFAGLTRSLQFLVKLRVHEGQSLYIQAPFQAPKALPRTATAP